MVAVPSIDTILVREEAEVAIITPFTKNGEIYDSYLQDLAFHLTQGFNVSIVMVGASGSGKSHTLNGAGNDFGIVHYFIETLFNSLDRKEEPEEQEEEKVKIETDKNYSVRMQLVEIVNEGVNDLLARGKGALAVETDEWEGASIPGADKKVINDAQAFLDLYNEGLKHKVTLINEFGRLADKAGTILMLELIQTVKGENENEDQVFVSKAMFIESPGAEALMEEVSGKKNRQAAVLNQGMLHLQKIVVEIISGRGERANYEGSQLTRLIEEIFGGNSITSMIFTLQYDDQIGSAATLRLLKQCQRIINYPITNDSRALCLLHRNRLAINDLKQLLRESGREKITEYQQKIANLEKKLISENIEEQRFNEESNSMNAKLGKLKDKYNAVVKQKAEVQAQLLQVEEEKLNLSKALIEQQIDNSKLQEELQVLKYESEGEKTAELNKYKKTIAQLEMSLSDLKNENQAFELELTTVKRNYFGKCDEVEQLKKKNEQIGIEFVSLVNENQALSKRADMPIVPVTDNSSRKATILEAENAKLKKTLARLEMELEKSVSDKVKAEAQLEQTLLEYDKKRVALEREFVNLTKSKDNQIGINRRISEEANRTIETEKNNWELEKVALIKKIKDASRKLEMASDELQETKELNEELIKDKKTTELQLIDARNMLRNQLTQLSGAEANRELLKTYEVKEKQSIAESEVVRKRMERLRVKCRTLREYARQLKYLCEDVYPAGKLKPDLLQDDAPPMIPEEQANTDKLAKKEEMLREELRRCREENNSLRDRIDELTEKLRKATYESVNASNEGMIQKKILEELQMLKEKPRTVQRPTSRNEELEEIRKERNRLLEENLKLRQFNEPDVSSGGNIKQLKQKILYLENAVKELEKERSELKVRATMAEQQLNTLQNYYQKATQDYQKKISELRQRIES